MKIKKIWIVTAAAALLLSLSAAADQAEYSTESDPLISLSYLKEVYEPSLKEQIKKEVLAELKSASETKPDENTQTALPSADSLYEVLHLTSGQVLMADSSMEILMTAGQATVVVTGEENIKAGVGLNDLTASKRLLAGEAFPQDHYVIIPRPDGRGLYVTSQDAYFMVRGNYTVGTF